MSLTNESEFLAEPEIPSQRPLPNLLVQGFLLALRNWPFVLWAYAINLLFGLLAGIPVASGLLPYLDHSLASQKIAGTIDLTYLGELAIHLRDTSFFPVAVHTAGWLSLLQLLVLFLFFAGTVFVYVSAEPPRLSVLLRGGVAYFWRFVRAGILVGCVAALILGILFAARAALLAHASEVYVDRKLFYYAEVSGAVILLVALLLRLWFDLVQVYVVRNAMDGERRAHQALLPAFQLLRKYFFRTVGSFLLAGLAGLSGLGLCLYLWKAFVPANQVWLAGLLAQVGLFVLLASRFWQRGLEAALVMSADPPIVASEEIAAMVEEEEETPSLAGVAGLSALTEPTLRELVQKLRSEPWAKPSEAPSETPVSSSAVATPVEAGPVAPSPAPPIPPPAPREGAGWPGSRPSGFPGSSSSSGSILDRHATKFPLGGVNPEREPPATSFPSGPQEKSKPVEGKPVDPNPIDDDQWPHRRGKPLP